MPKASPSLRTKLDSATSKTAWSTAVKTDLGSTLRLRCFRDANGGADPYATGTEFLNCAIAGPLNINATTGAIESLGALSNVTVHTAANLATGSSCLRIEGNGLYLQYTLGLTGSGKDFTVAANIAPGTGFAFSPSASLVPPTALPIADPGAGGGGGSTVGSVPVGGILTTVAFENTTASTATNQPVTFGQIFKQGALSPTGAAVALKAGASTIPAQIDVKATHADGTVRHAIISAIVPSLTASATQAYDLVRTDATTPTPAVPSDFAGMDSVVTLNIGGTSYSASLANVLTSGSTKWVQGDVATEWTVAVPLKTAGNVDHPTLHARFYVRGYKGTGKVKIDVIVENTWVKPNAAATAGQSAWTNIGMGAVTYDAVVTVAGSQVFSQSAIPHYPHARWKKTFWMGAAPVINVKQNAQYLIESRALPNYDLGITINPSAIAAKKTTFLANNGIMQNGMAEKYMPQTGGRDDIALLPGWDILHLLSQDKDARVLSLGQADLAGSWGAHFRNYDTGLPVTVAEYPYMTMVGNHGDCYNPTTQKYEDFPAWTSNGNPNVMQTAHHPDLSFYAYLISGEYYYLESLTFWAHYCTWQSNPGLRGAGLGLFNPDETRGQAWAIRTISHAAYIAPDAHPHKVQFATNLQNNFDWYNTNYTNNTAARMALGIMDKQAVVYPDTRSDANTGETLGVAPWQDDYFTSAVGRAVELGFTGGSSLLAWKAKFPILRLTSGSNFCYIYASRVALNIKAPSAAGGAYYTTINDIYVNSIKAAMRAPACGSQAMADAIYADYQGNGTLVPGQLIPDGGNFYDGYPSWLQPAVAYASTSGATGASNAWLVYSNRAAKNTDTGSHPQFSILPRA